MKYNDNGTYKDIYVKALDTLPVGAELDYDGERVPDGYVQVAGKNIITCKQTNETTYTSTNNFSSPKIILDTIVSQVGSDLELTNDGGIKIKGNFTKVKISGTVGLGSCSITNKNGISISKFTSNPGSTIGANVFQLLQSHTNNQFSGATCPEILIDVNQNDIIYIGVYTFTAGNVNVRVAYLTVEVVE